MPYDRAIGLESFLQLIIFRQFQFSKVESQIHEANDFQLKSLDRI